MPETSQSSTLVKHIKQLNLLDRLPLEHSHHPRNRTPWALRLDGLCQISCRPCRQDELDRHVLSWSLGRLLVLHDNQFRRLRCRQANTLPLLGLLHRALGHPRRPGPPRRRLLNIRHPNPYRLQHRLRRRPHHQFQQVAVRILSVHRIRVRLRLHLQRLPSRRRHERLLLFRVLHRNRQLDRQLLDRPPVAPRHQHNRRAVRPRERVDVFAPPALAHVGHRHRHAFLDAEDFAVEFG